MAFLPTAPGDGHPDMYPDPGSSACQAGLAGLAAMPEGKVPDEGKATPLVDPAALQNLGAELENPVVAKDFARDYVRMWDQRYASLASALNCGDEAGSLDAVLSLKISSTMVGGIQLSRLAAEVEEAIRGGDMKRARSFLPTVAKHGRETVDELRASQNLPDP